MQPDIQQLTVQYQALMEKTQFWNNVQRWQLWVMIIGIPLLLVMCIRIYLVLRDIRTILLEATKNREQPSPQNKSF